MGGEAFSPFGCAGYLQALRLQIQDTLNAAARIFEVASDKQQVEEFRKLFTAAF